MNRSVSASRGFTLIELMLVIVIIGYLVSLVRLPSISPNSFDLVEQETKKLATLINLASEYAIVNNAQVGLAVAENQYAFLIFQDEKWQRIQQQPFKTEPLPENITLELGLDNLPWQEKNLLSVVQFIDEDSLDEETADLSEQQKQLAFPQVFILSSGEISPFEIEVSYDDFDTEVMFLIQGLFTAPVKFYDPIAQEDLQR